jgi:hypothetical protein
MYEKRDANFRNLMLIAGGLALMVIVTMFAAKGLFGLLSEDTPQPGARPSPYGVLKSLPPQPYLQPNPPADLAEMHREEDSVLNSYGWVNRDSGLVRVPIERAMALLVKKGLPARETQPKSE